MARNKGAKVKSNQEGFSEEVLFEQILKEVREEAMQVIWGKSIPGRGNSLCKDPEIGLCLGHELRLLFPPRYYGEL